jgi:hypothetical protein
MASLKGSISHQQAQAIAEDFLDDLGEDRTVFEPEETYTQLIMMAGELIGQAQANLHGSNSVHSGKLSTSLTAEEPQLSNQALSIHVTMLDYGQYINKGVKGLKSGTGEFAFKYEMPSKKMVAAIKEYLRGGTVRVATINKKSVSRNEVKNVRLSEVSSAFALARSIKQHGIKPTHFMDKAIQSTEQKFDVAISQGLAIDLLNTLPDNI